MSTLSTRLYIFLEQTKKRFLKKLRYFIAYILLDKKKLREFAEKSRIVINLLETEKESDARDFFNTHIYKQYQDLIFEKKYKDILSNTYFFFLQLDEYLNNDIARSIQLSTKEYVFDAYEHCKAELAHIL